jgi:2-polyprenyl-3-methyl-5-hydroxy-6-metoxy-1,4-benzoquinol methylase
MRLQTNHPIALTSVDHTHPYGTSKDNSTNAEFNRRLAFLVGGDTPSFLDLGCAGGGLVESLAVEGWNAFGIDGSDYSQARGREAWGRMPERFFTADLTEPFLLLQNERVARFDVITMWEVLEHIPEPKLDILVSNLHIHTEAGAYFIGSVNSASGFYQGVEYHATQRPPEWWVAYFEARGWTLRKDLYAHFHPHWVRGPNTDGQSSMAFVFQKI